VKGLEDRHIRDSLRGMLLFKDLTTEELDTVARGLYVESLHPGSTLFSADQPGEVVYVISSGAVKVYIDGAAGRQVTLAILGPSEVVGEMSVADSLTHSASAATIEESTLYWMGYAHFKACLQEMAALNRNLTIILSRRLRLANAQIQSLSALDLYGRVARQLLTFAREYGQPLPRGGVKIPFRLTQSDLGDLVGASRGRVNGVLGAFREQGHISTESDYHITIHNTEALAQRCV
jgi:CRP/FNR family cyclic AMP-dependent transcriptional regulator